MIVLFTSTDGKLYKENFPEDKYLFLTIGPLGDFQSIEAAQNTIMGAKVVVMIHEGMVINQEILDSMIDRLSKNKRYGVIYSDYVQRINNSLIPRLRRTYKKSPNATKNKIVPIFGAVLNEEVVPDILAELVHTQKLNTDSFIQGSFDNACPYHIPEFLFQV